jgi:putative ABC transport system substrate-binding protein
MRRREFITLIGGAVATWSSAHAQDSTKTRIGITTIQPRTASIYTAFDARLRELGYIEGQNLIVDYLNPEDQAEGIAGAIKQLIRRKVDVIIALRERCEVGTCGRQ